MWLGKEQSPANSKHNYIEVYRGGRMTRVLSLVNVLVGVVASP